MPSIFDLVTSNEIVSYWETIDADTEGYLGEELWPSQQKLGLNLEWIKGRSGLPVVLKPSAYDVAAMKRDRIGFKTVITKMPFFKESTMIDEEMRQQLNMVLETGNQAYVDTVVNRIFDDEVELIKGAKAQRERMRMSLLTTGTISISANGQNYDYDYGFTSDQKPEATKSWSDPTADIISDIRTWMDDREEKTGVRPTRAILSRKTMGYLLKNNDIRNAIWGNNSSAPVSETKVVQYINTELDLSVAVYSKKVVDESGNPINLVPDDIFVLIPAGKLGTGWFGTTPVSVIDTLAAVPLQRRSIQ